MFLESWSHSETPGVKRGFHLSSDSNWAVTNGDTWNHPSNFLLGFISAAES